MKILNKHKVLLAMLLCGLGVFSGVQARDIDSQARQVRYAKWHKEANVSAKDLLEQSIPDGSASLFFLREQDDGNLQTSANVAVNDRFQVSLQPGNFSQVLSCSGINRLSAEITGHKNNDLLRNAVDFNLDEKHNYFFAVNVNPETGAASIRNLPEQEALALLDSKYYQTHQISRVVQNNCEQPKPAPAPEPITIELKVLFDFDKSFVKPMYYPEIEQVADYMKRFPQAKVTLEGHTDDRASNAYNIPLSQRRVNAVRDILVKHFGIDGSRIRAVGYGKTRPIMPNDTPEHRHQNRRVIAVFEPVDAMQ